MIRGLDMRVRIPIEYSRVNPKETGNSNGNHSVVSPCGLHFCLRQSGGRFAAGFRRGAEAPLYLRGNCNCNGNGKRRSRSPSGMTNKKSNSKDKIDGNGNDLVVTPCGLHSGPSTSLGAERWPLCRGF
jgi:hypothetical protein